MNIKKFIFALILLASLLGKTAFAAPPSPGALLPDDPRLEKKVTIFLPRAYVGEVLEAWSEQTGVPLSASEKDGAANELVSVFLQDVPLKKAMTALWSLLSYQKATWRWETTGADGRLTGAYVFHQSQAARELPNRLLKETDEDFAAHTKTMLSGLALTEEGRKSVAARDPIAGSLLSDASVRTGLSLFPSSLTAEQQDAILQGGKPIKLPVATLPPAAQAAVKAIYQRERTLNEKKGYDVSAWREPTEIRIEAPRVGLTRVLIIDVGELGGYGYLGGTAYENKWQQTISDLWLLPQDKPANGDESREITLPKDSKVEPLVSRDAEAARRAPTAENRQMLMHRDQQLRQAYRLWSLAEATGLPIIARLPRLVPALSRPTDPGGPVSGQKIEAFLAQAADNGLQHKWRDGVLLVASHRRLVDGTATMTEPWSDVKVIRTAISETNRDGTLTVAELAQIADHSSASNIQLLLTEYPNLGGIAYVWHDLFAYIAQTPGLEARLRTKSGVPFTEVARLVRMPLKMDNPRNKVPLSASVRLVEAEQDHRVLGPIRTYDLEAVTADGTVVTKQGFFQFKKVQAGDKSDARSRTQINL